MTMGSSISRSIDAPPVIESPVIETDTTAQPPIAGSTPPEQRTSGYTHDVVDAKHDPIAQFEMIFLGYSCVTSTGSLPIMFWVDDDDVPMKIEKLPGI